MRFLGGGRWGGWALTVEDTIKNLVSRHRCIYVSYTIDPAQAVLNKTWHVCGTFSYEFGLVDQALVKDFESGLIGPDQLKKTQLDVINIETLCTNFPHNKDQYALQSYAVASVERVIAKNWALRMSLGLS